MLKINERLVYRAFGLSIKSDIPLPELFLLVDEMDSVDVEIKMGELSKKKMELLDRPNNFVIAENLVMFQVSNIATFLIEDGKKITISPEKDADDDLIRLFVLGSCMGAILMQRRVLPLHGSAIAINGKAYAIVGESGAGKSTLASAFLSQGYKLLSDDVIAVSLSADEEIPLVTPSYPQQKLWEDSLKNFGMKSNDYQSIYGRENKYCIPVPSKFSSSILPLGGVFELVKLESSEIGICKIERLDRFHTLFCHTYRNFFIQKLGLMNWHFQVSANIIDKINMYQVRRPLTGSNATELVSAILNIIDRGE